METEITKDEKKLHLFNSPLEIGIRVLTILEAMFPRACSIREIIWFDYLVIYTGDLTAFPNSPPPSSLHPNMPDRIGEFFVRRNLVKEGLRLMAHAGLIEQKPSNSGLLYIPSENAPSFLKNLEAPYSIKLKKRAEWLANSVKKLSHKDLEQIIHSKINKWTIDLSNEGAP